MGNHALTDDQCCRLISNPFAMHCLSRIRVICKEVFDYHNQMKWSELNMRSIWLVVGLCLLSLALCGSATVPWDIATEIGLDQSVVDYAPGAYYKVDVPTPGTLSVVMEEVPSQMITWIISMCLAHVNQHQ
jgi:hypothetical protein